MDDPNIFFILFIVNVKINFLFTCLIQLHLNSTSSVTCLISAPLELNIICDKHIDVSSVTAAFQELFYNTNCVTYDVVSGLAAQIVGPVAAIEVGI